MWVGAWFLGEHVVLCSRLQFGVLWALYFCSFEFSNRPKFCILPIRLQPSREPKRPGCSNGFSLRLWFTPRFASDFTKIIETVGGRQGRSVVCCLSRLLFESFDGVNEVSKHLSL